MGDASGEAEKERWLAQFLYDRRQHKLHKVRMAAWHEAERWDELALEEAEQEGPRGKALAELRESLQVARMRLMGKVGQRSAGSRHVGMRRSGRRSEMLKTPPCALEGVVWSLWTLCPCSLDDRRVIAGCS